MAISLRLDWCSYEAAKYAVENWHYSERMPLPPVVMIGVWEDGRYIGCVLFARGANKNLGNPYGLRDVEIAELVRVALKGHATPVSRVVAIALKFLRRHCPGLRMLVSFADPAQGHHGGIYQAGNWIYAGASKAEFQYLHEGRWKHRREVVTKKAFGKRKAEIDWRSLPNRLAPGKHRYLMPFDDEMRAKLIPLARPYPKCAGSSASGTLPVQGGGGGATPTPALPSNPAQEVTRGR